MPWQTKPPFYVLIAAPLDQIAAVQAAFYMTPTTPRYTTSDAPIRSVTHRLCNGLCSTNLVIRETQQTAVDAWIDLYGEDGVSPEGVAVRKYLVGSPSPLAAVETLLGITASDGSM